MDFLLEQDLMTFINQCIPILSKLEISKQVIANH